MKICCCTMSTKLKNVGKYLCQMKFKWENQVKNLYKIPREGRGRTVNKCTSLY